MGRQASAEKVRPGKRGIVLTPGASSSQTDARRHLGKMCKIITALLAGMAIHRMVLAEEISFAYRGGMLRVCKARRSPDWLKSSGFWSGPIWIPGRQKAARRNHIAMAPGFDLIDQARRLQWMTTQTRMRLIESELALGATFCMVLETELRLGEFDAAHESFRKLERTVDAVRHGIRAAKGSSARRLKDLREKLASLQQRMRAIELRLTHPSPARFLFLVPWELPKIHRREIWS